MAKLTRAIRTPSRKRKYQSSPMKKRYRLMHCRQPARWGGVGRDAVRLTIDTNAKAGAMLNTNWTAFLKTVAFYIFWTSESNETWAEGLTEKRVRDSLNV